MSCSARGLGTWPYEPPALCLRLLQAQRKLLSYYAGLKEKDGDFNTLYVFNWISGVLDLSLRAQNLDADSQELTMTLSGAGAQQPAGTRAP